MSENSPQPKKLILESGKPVGITDGFLSLREDTSRRADKIIIEHHYSHKTTKNKFLSLLVNDGLGAVQLGYGIRPRMKHTVSNDITPDNFCEFDRMWLSDELPKFSESRVIALLISYIKQVHSRIKFIITYADESVGNKGTIYRATNAIELDSVEVSFYLLPSGERLHPVSMYHRHKTRDFKVIKEIYPGIIRLRGDRIEGLDGCPSQKISKLNSTIVKMGDKMVDLSGVRQRRFLYVLSRSMRRKFQLRNAVPPAQKDGFNSRTPLQVLQPLIPPEEIPTTEHVGYSQTSLL